MTNRHLVAEDPVLYVNQLTSLRGVACLVVLVGHVIQVINYHDTLASPFLRIVRSIVTYAFNAEAAVLLFFVLSGCVLSLSLKNVPALDVRAVSGFYVKRVFRIYPLLCLATCLAMVSIVVTRHLVGTGVFVDWLVRNLTTRLTVGHTLLSFTGLYTRYNGPMWSLRVELVYSVLFPAIYLLVKNTRVRFWVLGVLAVIALLPIPSQLGAAFAVSFAAGALIPLLPVRQAGLHGSVAVAALIVLLYDRLVLAGLHPPDRVFDVIETAAAFYIVRDVYASGRSYRLLMYRPTVWLGELSFGVYLLHLPILLMIFTVLQHFIGLPVLLDHPSATQIGLTVLTASVTVCIAAIVYNFFELPLHNIGRRLGKRVAQGNRVPVKAGSGMAQQPVS